MSYPSRALGGGETLYPGLEPWAGMCRLLRAPDGRPGRSDASHKPDNPKAPPGKDPPQAEPVPA
jgi:hypothetical protein